MVAQARLPGDCSQRCPRRAASSLRLVAVGRTHAPLRTTDSCSNQDGSGSVTDAPGSSPACHCEVAGRSSPTVPGTRPGRSTGILSHSPDALTRWRRVQLDRPAHRSRSGSSSRCVCRPRFAPTGGRSLAFDHRECAGRRCDPSRRCTDSSRAFAPSRLEWDSGRHRRCRPAKLPHPTATGTCSVLPRSGPNNAREFDVGRSEQIGIIDLQSLRALAAWIAARQRTLANGVDLCLSSRNESRSPPALVEACNAPPGSTVDSGDRSGPTPASASDPLASDGQITDAASTVGGGA